MAALSALWRDDSISLMLRGYGFGAYLWKRTEDAARAVPFRLLGRDALFVRGAEGVELFYDENRVRRHGAMPAFIQESLFGHGSVHSLDGAEHKHRKKTFVDALYGDDDVARLAPFLEQEWRAELDAWTEGGHRSAYQAAVGAFGRAIMRWAGIPGTPAAQTRWARRQAQIVDGFGVPYSPEFVLALLNRRWSDQHAEHLIEAVRLTALHPQPGTALHAWAWHRDPRGELLPPRLAGVELQNSFRPMIAVSRFVAFAAKQLHEHPEWRARIATETAEQDSLVGGEVATMFAQEIRRTAPFVPMLPAWVRTDVEFDGERVRAGSRVVLDIMGTDTDARSWERPLEFDPERFRGVSDYEKLASFVPHGGGGVLTGHRCPGEKLAIAGLAAAIATLANPRIRIVGHGLQTNSRRMPTRPRSGGRIRPAEAGARCPFH